MPDFIQAVRQKVGRPPLTAKEVPGRLVRDIALPVFGQNHTHSIVECRTTTPRTPLKP